MNQYEYKTITIKSKGIEVDSTNITHCLNIHGKEGWELITAYPQFCLGSTTYSVVGIGVVQKITLILKRAIPQPKAVAE